MNIGFVTLSTSLLVLVGAGAIGIPLINRYLIPQAQRALARARGEDVSGAAAQLIAWRTMRSIAVAAVAAPLTVAAVYSVAQWRIGSGDDDPARLESVVGTRDLLERTLEPLAGVSLAAWVLMLIVVGGIWIAARRSGSRRSWNQALDARQRAHATALKALNTDAVLSRAKKTDPKRFAELEERAEALRKENLARVEGVRSSRVLSLPGKDGQQQPASIAEIHDFIRQLENDASRLDTLLNASPEDAGASGDIPDSQKAAARHRVEGMRSLASRLREQMASIVRQVRVPLRRMNGMTIEKPFADAEKHADVQPQELRQDAEEILLQAKKDSHDQRSLAKDRREPETIREWFAAVASGELAVAAFAASGAVASKTLQIALIAGLIGIGAHASDVPGLIEHAKGVELTLMAGRTDAEVANLLGPASTAPTADESRSAESVSDVPDCDAAPEDCADDERTVERLRTVFRTSAIRSLQREVGVQAGLDAVDVRRRAFRLGAVDARRAILANAQRDAGPTFDTGAERARYRSTASPSSRPAAADVLDEALDRRIDALRRHEPSWQRARRWAARPVSADAAAEAWLRTAFGELGQTSPRGVRIWAERASGEFVAEIARTGSPDAGARVVAESRAGAFGEYATARDSRIFRDFTADAPERVGERVARYSDGIEDPGSLRRASSRSGQSAGAYERLFSTSVDGPDVARTSAPARRAGGVNTSAARGSRVGAGVRTARAGRVPVARSFGRIRFSGRIGGVVFGRPPNDGGEAPDIVAMSWSFSTPTRVILTLESRTAERIRLGPYHPSILHHALAFAADGRVVVSTLPQVQPASEEELPIPARRVVVHPAFEDTAFACSAIQVDRFVDTFTYADPDTAANRRQQTIARVRQGVSMLGLLLSSELDDLPSENRIGVMDAVRSHAVSCRDDDCFPLRYYEKMGFDFGSAPSFVNCLRESGGGAAMLACHSQLKPGKHTYSVDSGVRERAYELDPSLAFVTGARSGDDPLWPIEFMIQAVPQSRDGGDTPIGDDGDPWEFPLIAETLHAEVARGVASDARARSVYWNTRDFVAVQRLFRAGLEGNLGLSFPLDELIRLSEVTRDSVKVRRNERWNVNQGFHEFVMRVNDWTTTRLAGARSSVRGSCREKVDEVLRVEQRSPWPRQYGLWTFLAELDEHCNGQLPRVRDIQQELRRQDVIDEVLSLDARSPASATRFYCEAL